MGGGREQAGPGRRRARGAPGRGARFSRARFALPPPLPFLSPADLLANRPRASQADGWLSLLRAAVQPLGATKAGGHRGEASAQTPGSHVEPSSARPPFQGSRARVSLGAGLPYIWARGLTSTRIRPDLSTRVLGTLFTVPHPTLGAETRTPPPPPARLYANMHAAAHWDRATRRKTCTCKHLHSLCRGALSAFIREAD